MNYHERFVNSLKSIIMCTLILKISSMMHCENEIKEQEHPNSSPDSLAHDIYAMSGSKPSENSTSPNAFPMIPIELYEAIPEEVKLIMRQQQGGRQGSLRCPQTPNHQSINNITTFPVPGDQF